MSSSFSNAPQINISQSWVQVGNSINGVETWEEAGYSVSLSGDGSIVAVGAPGSDSLINGIHTIFNTGEVRIYQLNENNWVKIGNSIEEPGAGYNQYDKSGRSVALSSDGNIVAVGAPHHDSWRGKVRIYQNDNGTWTQIGNDINGDDSYDFSGASISISGDGLTVAIGAYKNIPDSSNFGAAGQVRIYQNDNGTWTQIGEDINGNDVDEWSGWSVSLSEDGNVVAIGATRTNGNNVNDSDFGSVSIYQNDNGTWTQIGNDILGNIKWDNFGNSVSLSSDGSIVAIGTNSDANGKFNNSGHVRIYQNDHGTWTQIGENINGEAKGDAFGQSVSISNDGSIIAIGAPYNYGNGSDSGQVRIYQNDHGTWTQIGKNINGEAKGDDFGQSVSISNDGSTIAIGAPYNNGNGEKRGSVRIYNLRFNTNQTVYENEVEIATYTANDADAGDIVSWSLSGDNASLFEINSGGELRFKSAPDYENPLGGLDDNSNIYSLKLIATDLSGKQDIEDVTVNILDINDSNPVLNFETTSIVSTQENSTTVATYSVTDADDGDTVSFSISGDDSALFDIDSTTGVLTFASAPDYETPRSAEASNAYSLTVTATDRGGNKDTSDVTVNVENLDEIPVLLIEDEAGYESIAAQASIFGVDENSTTVANFGVSKDSGDIHTYSLSGRDASLFNIDDSGSLIFKYAPNFEPPFRTDTVSFNQYAITQGGVESTYNEDNLSAIYSDEWIFEDISTVDEGGLTAWDDHIEVISQSESNWTIVRLSRVDGQYFSLRDFDYQVEGAHTYKLVSESGYEYQVSHSEDDVYGRYGDVDQNILDANFTSISYVDFYSQSVNDGYGDSLTKWHLDDIQLSTPLVIYSTSVAVTDKNNNADSTDLLIILEDVLEYPILNVGSTSIVEVEKNSKKVATYVATDDDYLDKVTYSISGDDSDLFNINSESGELTFKSAPDYENPLGGTSNDPNTYSIRVNAVDKTGRADYTDVSVNVIDTLDDSSLLKIDTTSAASVDENTTLVHTFTADKPVTWSLVEGNDSHFFAVNTSKGSLSFSSAPDFENPSDADQNNDYVVTIRATDNENNTSEQTITVTINDVNEQVKERTEPEISKKENYDLIKSAEYEEGNFNFTLFSQEENNILDAGGNEDRSKGFIDIFTYAFDNESDTYVNIDATGLQDDDYRGETFNIWSYWIEAWNGTDSLRFDLKYIDSKGTEYLDHYYYDSVNGLSNKPADEKLAGEADLVFFEDQEPKQESEIESELFSLVWTKLLGSTSSDYSEGIITGNDGSIFITGDTTGDFDGEINIGGFDVFITKLDSDGNKEWTKLFGTSSDDISWGIAKGNDGSIYITGETEGNPDEQVNSGGYDAFIGKFDSDGNREWTKLLGSSNDDYSTGITTANDGSIYITGETEGDLDGQINSGGFDVFISKLDSDGSKEWTKLLGSSNDDRSYGITTANDGSIYITGDTTGDFDGQINSGDYDAFISKFDSNGNKEWTKLLGSSSYDYSEGITTANDGSIYITGGTAGDLDGQANNGEIDAFISKFDSEGNKEWTKLLGSSNNDESYGITTANDGSIYITGNTTGDFDGEINSGGFDAFISKFDSEGNKEWTKLLGSSNDDESYGITTANDGSIYITGDTKGDLDGQINSGDYDVFISKFKDQTSNPEEITEPDSDPIAEVTEPYQTVSASIDEISFSPGNDINLDLVYTTSDIQNALPGLGLKVHYDSSLFTPSGDNNGVSALVNTFGNPSIIDDTDDFDNDTITDKYLNIIWADLTTEPNFPGTELPATLATVNFSSSKEGVDSLTGESKESKITFTSSSPAQNYDFLSQSVTLKPQSFNLDVDGDGKVTALGDGLMVIRKLFGAAFAGDVLTNKAISNDATRSTDEIHEFIKAGMDEKILDVDGDGSVTALGDGLMVIRKLFGAAFAGDSLTSKALSNNATRTTDEIHDYIAAMSDIGSAV